MKNPLSLRTCFGAAVAFLALLGAALLPDTAQAGALIASDPQLATEAIPATTGIGGLIGMATILPAFTNSRYRAAYDYLLGAMTAESGAYGGSSDQIITQSYLRSEMAVSNSKSSYRFNLTKENDTPTPPEQRLDKNDVFVALNWGFYLVQYPTSSGEVTDYNGVLQQYPNAVGLSSSATLADLIAFWYGNWKIQVGKTVFFDAYPNLLNLRFPETQQRAEVTDVAPAIAYSDADYTMVPPIEPFPILSGSASNTVELSVPIWDSWGGAASGNFVIKAVAVLHGLLAKNAANYIRF